MKRLLTSVALASLLAACATVPAPFVYVAPAQPEGSSGYTAKPGWATKKFAVAAANPLATDAGLQVLRAGGSAIDAAVAVQMVLTLVEPQSSGIGGGACMLQSAGSKVEAFDGRETAPAGVGRVALHFFYHGLRNLSLMHGAGALGGNLPQHFSQGRIFQQCARLKR